MKILVLGAGGFLGQAIAPKLAAAGHSVTGVIRNPLERRAPGDGIDYVEAILDDTRSIAALAADAEGILHLAWDTTPGTSRGQPTLEAVNNLLPTFRLLETIQATDGFPLVFVSSAGATYADTRAGPVDEDARLDPRSCYGAGKLAAEHFLRAFSAQTGHPVVIVRPSNVYGPGQAPKRQFGIVPTIMRALAEDRPFTVWGDGETTRNFLYVDDFADLVVRIAERSWQGTEVFNAGSAENCSINRLCDLLEGIAGRRLQREYRDQRGIDPEGVAIDSGRARRELGWAATTTLEVGLAAAWDWYTRTG